MFRAAPLRKYTRITLPSPDCLYFLCSKSLHAKHFHVIPVLANINFYFSTVTGGVTVWISPYKVYYHAQISFWVRDIFVYHFLLQLRLFSVSANFSGRRAREMTLLMSRRRRKSRFFLFFGRNRNWNWQMLTTGIVNGDLKNGMS